MKNNFVNYEQALALDLLGFEEECFGHYLCKNSAFEVYLEITSNWIDLLPYDSSSCKAPLYQQAFKFFRDKYKLDGRLTSWLERGEIVWYISTEPIGKPSRYKPYESVSNSPEEAEVACINKLIELVKKT